MYHSSNANIQHEPAYTLEQLASFATRVQRLHLYDLYIDIRARVAARVALRYCAMSRGE